MSFNTDSDTEVILELWRKYNSLTFNMLRGMFALAIHDLNTNETIIARDHFGINLYITSKIIINLFFHQKSRQ